MKYVYVSQGKTARYEPGKTPSEIEGIYTNQFSHCNFVILVGKRTNRISVTHADYEMEEEHFIAEMDWVDNYSNDPEIERIIVARKSIADSKVIREKILPNFAEFFTVYNIENNYDGVLFKTNGKIIRLQNSDGLAQEQKYIHPQQQNIDRVYKLNNFLSIGFLKDRKRTTLIYNGANWSNLLEHDCDLTDIAKQRLTMLQLASNSSIAEIRNALYQLMLKNRKYYQHFLTNKNQCELMLDLHAPLVKDYLIWREQESAIMRNSQSILAQENSISDLISKIGINSQSNKLEEFEGSPVINDKQKFNNSANIIEHINAVLGTNFIKKYIATGSGEWQVEQTSTGNMTLSLQGLQIAKKSDCDWYRAKLLKGGIKEQDIHFDECRSADGKTIKYKIRLTNVQNIKIVHNLNNNNNNLQITKP